MTQQGRFTLDHFDDERSWPAERFGQPWNGFATPVVTKETLVDLLDAVNDGHRWDGDTAVVWSAIDLGPDDEPEFEDRVDPDAEGHYDLAVLGWTFERV